MTHEGYVRITAPGHPFGRGPNSYVMEHRLVVEADLRVSNPASEWLVRVDDELYLGPHAEVHHVDGDRGNNQLENLEVMSKADHARLHMTLNSS